MAEKLDYAFALILADIAAVAVFFAVMALTDNFVASMATYVGVFMFGWVIVHVTDSVARDLEI